jgi:hypothetical protein
MQYADMPDAVLVKLLAQSRAAEKVAKDQAGEIKRVLNTRYKTAGSFPVEGGLILRVSGYSKFDAATARTNLSAAKLKLISVLTPDSTMAKKMLAPVEYDRTKKVYDHSLTVEFND